MWFLSPFCSGSPVFLVSLGLLSLMWCMLFGCASHGAARPDANATARQVPLHLALQDGFEHDDMVIRVNGEDVFTGTDISTDLRISLATTVDLEVTPGATTIEIVLTTRHLRATHTVDIRAPIYLAINITRDAQIRFRESLEPFGYV